MIQGAKQATVVSLALLGLFHVVAARENVGVPAELLVGSHLLRAVQRCNCWTALLLAIQRVGIGASQGPLGPLTE